ncbi:MAG: hypothetical protein ABFE02_16165 [Sulfuricella sp.]
MVKTNSTIQAVQIFSVFARDSNFTTGSVQALITKSQNSRVTQKTKPVNICYKVFMNLFFCDARQIPHFVSVETPNLIYREVPPVYQPCPHDFDALAAIHFAHIFKAPGLRQMGMIVNHKPNMHT